MIRKVKQSLRAHQRTFTHFKLLFFFCFCFFLSNKPIRAQTCTLTHFWLAAKCVRRIQAGRHRSWHRASGGNRLFLYVWRAKNWPRAGRLWGQHKHTSEPTAVPKKTDRARTERRKRKTTRWCERTEWTESVWQASGAPSLCSGFMRWRRWGDVTADPSATTRYRLEATRETVWRPSSSSINSSSRCSLQTEPRVSQRWHKNTQTRYSRKTMRSWGSCRHL